MDREEVKENLPLWSLGWWEGKEGAEEGKVGNEKLMLQGALLVLAGFRETYAEWLHFTMWCPSMIRRLQCWGPSLREREREWERELNLHSEAYLGTHVTWTQNWQPEACHGTCCGNGRDDPTVFSGWTAWPGAGWGREPEGLQPERVERGPSKQGRHDQALIKTGKNRQL